MVHRALRGVWPTRGDLMFWDGGGHTVYAVVFQTGVDDADQAIARMLEGRPGEPVRTYDPAEPGLEGHAYLLPERRGAEEYWGSTRGRRRGGRVRHARVREQPKDYFN